MLRDLSEDDIALMLRADISLPITTPAAALELIQRAIDVATSLEDNPSEGTILNPGHSVIYAAYSPAGIHENGLEILQAGARYSA